MTAAFDGLTGRRATRRSVVLAGTVGAAWITAACGSAGGGMADQSAKPATIEVWSPEMPAAQATVQDQVIKEFQDKYPNITTKLTVIPGGWDPLVEKLQVSVSGGVQPNTTRLPDNPLRLLIANKQIMPLDALIKRDNVNVKVLDKGMIERGTVDGKLHILPWSGGILALYFNQDLFERAGVTLPEPTKAMTWERFVDAATKVRRLGDDHWGFRWSDDYNNPTWSHVKNWLPWLWSNGNDYFDKTETKPLFGDAKGVASVQFLTDLILKHRVTNGHRDARPDQFQGKVGMWINQSGDIENAKTRAPSMRYGTTLIPIGPDGKTSYGPQGGSFISIAQGAKDVDQTWRYMRWVTDEEINLRLVTPAFQDPVHAANQVKPPFSTIPQYRAFVEQFKTAKARPGNPIYRPTEDTTAAQLVAAYKGEKTPADAVKAAVEQAQNHIQQNTKK
ncbi:MAG TPA: extracellular solute-binding protein [Chloroflexota bacterium]|jgi:multiple sugar transport system substrate-binding protein|nr:extracellular solute-binding protein [Chloroflexota bacterium]